jgi:tyrosine-protein kinase Etk/Wzc
LPEENKEVNDSSSSFTILEIITVFIRNRIKILIMTGIICVLSIVLYFFVFDLIYKSSASIKSSSKSSGLLGALDAGLPDLGGLDDIGVGSGSKSAKELAGYQEILYSRRCLEKLILKFGLMERDEYMYMEDAVKDFRENKLDIQTEKMAGVMLVSVLDKDPVLAKQMVEFLLEELDKINIELNITNAKNNREFIERRFFQAKEDLTKVEDSLKSFQLIYGIAPDLQIKAAAQSVFTLEAELKAEEVKLDVVKKILSADQPEVKLQEAKVNSLKDKISGIQTSTDLNDFLRLGNSPQIAMTFLRLQRDLEIQTKILTFMLPIYEQAKIEEKRETPTILILDKPVVSERKTKPKRLTMVIVLTVIGFLGTSVFYLVKHKWKIFKADLKLKKNSQQF